MANVLVERSSLEDIGNAIREKKSTNERHIPAELGDAIRSIPATSAELPELTSPAGAADIANGKQAIGANGQVINGTLERMKDGDVFYDEAFFEDRGHGIKFYAQVGSHIDGSIAGLSIDAPDALPENIVAGKNILGLVGASKRIVSASGTITPAADNSKITVETGLVNLQEIALFAEVDDPATLQTGTVLKANAAKLGISSYVSSAFSTAMLSGNNNACGVAVARTSSGLLSAGVSGFFNNDSVEISTANTNRVFRAGQQYQWVAYGWDDVVPHHSNGGEQA